MDASPNAARRPVARTTGDSNTVEPEGPKRRYVYASLFFVAVGLVVAYLVETLDWSAVASTAVEGVTVFAILFVLAQAIERVVELVLPWLDGFIVWLARRDATKDQRSSELLAVRKTEAIRGIREVTNAGIANVSLEIGQLGATDSAALAQQATETTDAEKKTKEVRNETRLLTQSMSFAMAIVLVAWFQFSLASAIGFENVPIWLDFLLTATAIMGGSAGLHDLLSNIQKQKETEEAKAS